LFQKNLIFNLGKTEKLIYFETYFIIGDKI
jgi:hypothetical protein